MQHQAPYQLTVKVRLIVHFKILPIVLVFVINSSLLCAYRHVAYFQELFYSLFYSTGYFSLCAIQN